MKAAFFVITTAIAAGAVTLVACGSDGANTSSSGTTSSTTTTTTGAGGAGGEVTTTSAGGAGGTGGMGQGGGTGGAGGAPLCQSLGDACSMCLYASCQDLYCTCYNNQACTDLVFTCLNQCDPASADYQMCTQDCATMYPGGVSDGALLGGCSDQNCAADCPTSGIPIDPCSECLFTNCSNEMNACFANAECAAILQCAQECPVADPGNPDCPTDCATMHPLGAQQALAVLNCSNTNCSTECQFSSQAAPPGIRARRPPLE